MSCTHPSIVASTIRVHDDVVEGRCEKCHSFVVLPHAKKRTLTLELAYNKWDDPDLWLRFPNGSTRRLTEEDVEIDEDVLYILV